ncbi:hypothetical protein EL17_09385 [Anditalea andensis]|uniref:Uncharacterized protein n=1 Tax=Anditalea andensis TaxID=1048983 RepID=A0A074KZH9_9BACT|nr:hypothetical protein EL17_09385 [Anditalea andensis]
MVQFDPFRVMDMDFEKTSYGGSARETVLLHFVPIDVTAYGKFDPFRVVGMTNPCFPWVATHGY